MAAHDLKGGDCLNRNGNQSDEMKNFNILLANVNRFINDIEQRVERMREYIIQQISEYQPRELAMTVVDLNFRDNTLFRIWRELSKIENRLSETSADLTTYLGSLNESISSLAESHKDQKSKDLECQREIEKKKAEIKTKMESKSKSHCEQQGMVMNIQRLILDAEQMRLEAISNDKLFDELLNEAGNQMERVEAIMLTIEYLIKEALILTLRIRQERYAIIDELRRKANEIVEEANRQQKGQTTMTIETIIILIAIAAAVGRRSLKQEAEKTNGSAEEKLITEAAQEKRKEIRQIESSKNSSPKK